MSDKVSVGTLIYSAARPIFKVYMILFTGYFLAKRNWLSTETLRNLSNMVLIAFMPCLVIDKVITYISDSDIKQIGIIVLSAVMMYASGFLYALILSFVLPVPKRWKGGFIVGSTLPNVSDLPIAYVQSMSGGVIFNAADANKGVAYIIIYLATYIFVQFTCGLFRLVEYDFRELPSDDEKKMPDSSEEDEDDQKVSSLDETDLPSSNNNNRRLDSNGLPILDEEGTPLSPTSTLSSASVHGDNTDLLVVPLDDLNPHEHVRITTSNLSRRRSRRYSNNSDLLRPIRSGRSTRSVMSSNELVREYSRADSYNSNLTTAMSIITENVSSKTIKDSGANIKFVQRYKLNWLVFILKNFMKPASVALIFSLTMAMIPWCKALFVETKVYMPSAPDQQPPLAFIIDYASYVGQAAVPLGLILLGATIARLEVKTIPKGFWQCCLLLTGWRLCIMPIWGVLWCNRLQDNGWITGDNLLAFVIMLQWSLPSATVQVYLTASYSDPESEDHIQMDCLAIYVMSQYGILFITLPTLVSYALKVNLGY